MEYSTAAGVCWILIFVVPLWMVAVLCMKCHNTPPTRIASYGEYIGSNSLRHFSQGNTVSSFAVIRQHNYQTPAVNHLLSPSPIPNSRRTSLLQEKESDNESLPNYENTAKESSDDETDYPQVNSNYIVVIPDEPTTVASPLTTRTSHVNRISSGTLMEDYENLKEETLNETQGGSSNYVNIDEMNPVIEKESEEEEDYEEGFDYVNSSKCVAQL